MKKAVACSAVSPPSSIFPFHTLPSDHNCVISSAYEPPSPSRCLGMVGIGDPQETRVTIPNLDVLAQTDQYRKENCVPVYEYVINRE